MMRKSVLRVLVLTTFAVALLVFSCRMPLSESDDKYGNGVPTGNGGPRNGNGGYALVCPAPSMEMNGRSAVAVDLWWGITEGLRYDLGGPDLSAMAKAQLIIERLARLDPDRAQRYATELQQFDSLTQEVGAGEILIAEPLDFNSIRQPSDVAGCESKLVIYRDPSDVAKPFKLIRDVARLLDSDSMAALIMHELAYLEARELGHTSSTGVRILIATAAAGSSGAESKRKPLTRMTPQEYAGLLLEAGFSGIRQMLGFSLDARSLTFHAQAQNLLASGIMVGPTRQIVIAGNHLKIHEGTRVFFHENGRLAGFAQQDPLAGPWIQSGWVYLNPDFRIAIIPDMHGEAATLPSEIRLHRDQDAVAEVRFARKTMVTADFSTNRFGGWLAFGTELAFFANGNPSRAAIVGAVDIGNGQRIPVAPGSVVEFHESGLAASLTVGPGAERNSTVTDTTGRLVRVQEGIRLRFDDRGFVIP